MARSAALGGRSTEVAAAAARSHDGEAVIAAPGRSVLVVTTVEDADADVLRAHVGDADTTRVVVPVVRQGVLDWLANDERAYGEAEAIAQRTADRLPGETTEASAGAPNVELAIRDALATFAADEILVAVRPEREEGAVEGAATADAPRRSFDGIPVRFVVIPDDGR